MRFWNTDPHLFPPVISGFSGGVVDVKGTPRSWEMSSSPSCRRLSSASPLCVFFLPPAPADTPSAVLPKLPRDPGLQEVSNLEVVNMNEVFKKKMASHTSGMILSPPVHLAVLTTPQFLKVVTGYVCPWNIRFWNSASLPVPRDIHLAYHIT